MPSVECCIVHAELRGALHAELEERCMPSWRKI